MALRENLRETTARTWWSNNGVCGSPYNGFGETLISESYHKVISERRVKPGGKQLNPNYFRVEKFDILDYDEDEYYCLQNSSNGWISGINMGWPVDWYYVMSQPFADWPVRPGPLEDTYELVKQNAIRDCFAKANSPAVFDLAPMLFELGETLSWIRKVFSGMLKIFSTGRFAKDFATRILEPEGLWLEYRYAVMPLILTISDAIAAFEGGMERKTYDTRIVLENQKTELEDRRAWGTPDGFVVRRVSCEDDVSATARIYVKTQCDPAPLGTGLWDVIRGTWEIVPLSFVVDWFFGVGDWLNSVRDTNLEVESSYVTVVVDREGTLTTFGEGPVTVNGSGVLKFHHYVMERSTDIEPPQLPLLQAEKLSALRTADAITLTISILKGFLTSKRR
jgi:hypothetical protein